MDLSVHFPYFHCVHWFIRVLKFYMCHLHILFLDLKLSTDISIWSESQSPLKIYIEIYIFNKCHDIQFILSRSRIYTRLQAYIYKIGIDTN